MGKSDITLQDLVRAGLLFRKDLLLSTSQQYFSLAQITDDGWMRVLLPALEDDLHDNPSGAGRALKTLAVKEGKIKSNSVQGWTFWQVMRLRDAPNAPLSRDALVESFTSRMAGMHGPTIDYVLLDDLRKRLRLRQSIKATT